MRRLLLAALTCVPMPVLAQGAPPTKLSCAGPFGKEATHVLVQQVFGSGNVAYTSIQGAEGEMVRATVVFRSSPEKRLEIVWDEEKARRRPMVLVRSKQSGWAFDNGLRIGVGLAEVEAINGKPFQMSGFEWDYGGFVSDWKGGALEARPGGCRVRVRFAPGGNLPEALARKVSGDTQLVSSSPDVRAAKPVVTELSIMWPR